MNSQVFYIGLFSGFSFLAIWNQQKWSSSTLISTVLIMLYQLTLIEMKNVEKWNPRLILDELTTRLKLGEIYDYVTWTKI